MLSIGLTGSFGTGKTTVAKMFAARGADVLDADKMAKGLIAKGGKCFRPVVREFGTDILARGAIDKKRLARIVFGDARKRRKLEKIVHPQVIAEIRKKLRELKRAGRKKVVAVDVPLLFESGLNKYVDKTVVVIADQQKQIARIQGSKKMARSEILRRIKSQWPIRRKTKLADFIIDNRGGLKQTQDQVQKIWVEVVDINDKRKKEK